MLEDLTRKPATDKHIDHWILGFSITNFAVVRDADRWVTNFFDSGSMPLNVVVDLASMKILHKQIGGNLAAVEAVLEKHLQ